MPDESNQNSLLVSAAKAIGKAAGKVAAVTGGHPKAEPQPTALTRKGKLTKKNKSRLPRRKKKAQKRQMRPAA